MPFMPYPTGTVVDPPMATRGMPTMSAPQQATPATPAPVAPEPAAPAPVASSAPAMPSADAPMASPFEPAGGIAPTGTVVNPRKPYTGSFAFGGGSRSGYAW